MHNSSISNAIDAVSGEGEINVDGPEIYLQRYTLWLSWRSTASESCWKGIRGCAGGGWGAN